LLPATGNDLHHMSKDFNDQALRSHQADVGSRPDAPLLCLTTYFMRAGTVSVLSTRPVKLAGSTETSPSFSALRADLHRHRIVARESLFQFLWPEGRSNQELTKHARLLVTRNGRHSYADRPDERMYSHTVNYIGDRQHRKLPESRQLFGVEGWLFCS
jgi:hypothetical protein